MNEFSFPGQYPERWRKEVLRGDYYWSVDNWARNAVARWEAVEAGRRQHRRWIEAYRKTPECWERVENQWFHSDSLTQWGDNEHATV